MSHDIDKLSYDEKLEFFEWLKEYAPLTMFVWLRVWNDTEKRWEETK